MCTLNGHIGSDRFSGQTQWLTQTALTGPLAGTVIINRPTVLQRDHEPTYGLAKRLTMNRLTG